MNFIDFNLEFSQSSYIGSCTVNLSSYADWKDVDYLQPAILNHNGTDYHFIVASKSRTETHSNEILTVELKSPAILLDFPYAKEVSGSFIITGTMSQICDNLAQLEGLNVVWDISVDDPLTINDVQVEGKSPLEAISEIVNAVGGIIQSWPDGTIHAEPEYAVDTNVYDLATVSEVFTSGDDFVSIQDESDKRDGFNKFEIVDVSSDSGPKLETEEVTPSHYKVKAFEVPWSGVRGTLTTSELTNVIIVPVSDSVVESVTEEDVEIVDGSGSVDKPCYGGISWDYKTSTDLGAITITEDGTVTTAIQGDTLVTITYDTKYWLWDAYDKDVEQVQFILD